MRTAARDSSRLAASVPALIAALAMLGSSTRAAERLTLSFDPDWKFIKADPPGAAAPDFDDSKWAVVSAPHTFNDVDTFDDFSPLGHVGELNQWAGRTWYRKSFVLPEAFKGKKIYVEFEAVRQVAEVYLNGQLLGVSKTGFIPFGFDLTPHLRWDGAANVLAVMADNTFTHETSMAGLAASDLPWNSPHWHPAHGGIYRNVYLHVADPLHISLPLFSFIGTTGPYVYASNVSDKLARMGVDVPVQNERASAAAVELAVEVRDRDGQKVLALNQGGTIAAGARATYTLAGVVKRPQLWESAYPYLYRVICSLRVHGETIDSYEIPFGFRALRFDAQNGFFINGHHVKLRGWGQKPTDEWPGLGAAQPDWMHFYTLSLMREAGGNFVRWGHCASGPASIAAGDRLGILADQPGVDGEADAHGEAWKIRAAAFRDMLIYFRNHPSIAIWEGGNQKVSREHAQELRSYVDQYDPRGGRALAFRRADQVTAEFMDVGIGTEGGREIKALPVVEGEYDREESPRRVWDNDSPPNFGYPEAAGQTYQLTAEQYAVNQVAQFVRKLGARDHCGGANWIFSDSTSGGRLACEVARASGEVDGVRLPKEAYYVCRTMFRGDAQVHIIGHWTYPAGTRKTIYVVSNGNTVELFLNGRSLGHGQASDRYLFTFRDVAWQPGEIKAVAYARGKAVATQIKRTAGPPVALRLTPITGPGGLHADGSDIALIDVEAVDSHGERCPTFQEHTDFEIEGPGIWRGGYNSGKIRSINNLYLDLEGGINRVAVRTTRTPGAITVRARSLKLEPATITLESAAVEVRNGWSDALPAWPAPALPANRAAAVATEAGALRFDSARQTQASRFVTAFSYSGSAEDVHIEQLMSEAGFRAYVDRHASAARLPAALVGSDYVQAADADGLYSAVDLMELSVGAGATVSVAHDDRLGRPEWLTQRFKATDLSVLIDGQRMTIFQHHADRAESLTLGSNATDASAKECNMYVVFVTAPLAAR